jgi:hypothetical protein
MNIGMMEVGHHFLQVVLLGLSVGLIELPHGKEHGMGKATDSREALSQLLAAEADYLHATGWKPSVRNGGVYWSKEGLTNFSQILAVQKQRVMDGCFFPAEEARTQKKKKKS